MKHLYLSAAFGLLVGLSAAPQVAEAASAEEVKICKETISEMTGGKPPAAAVLNEAIEKAMAGG